jgi:5-methylcytosine-specific restriction endonuclease McrA
MNFDDYTNSLPSRISPVKSSILKKLWHSDSSPFPKPWVSSAELLELTGQKYFDRRARELRDQLGCDIATQYQAEFGGHAWRINSPNLAIPQDRDYLSQTQKNKLFSDANNACKICGKVVAPGVRGLQADHKVPVSRGGTNDRANWQPICNNCNVGKRRDCEGCLIDCQVCSWAYPEIIGINTLVSLDEQLLSKIDEYSKAQNTTISHVVQEALIYFLENRDRQ